jgi:hypothetical protein
MIVLKTRYTIEKESSTVVVAKSPIVAAGFGAEPRYHRPREVDPVHRHAAPRKRERDPAGPDASGARSFPASSAKKSTVGPRTSGSNLSAASSSYVAATGSSK